MYRMAEGAWSAARVCRRTRLRAKGGIVSKPVRKPVDKLTLFRSISLGIHVLKMQL